MRSYEELFILKPDTPEEDADAYLGQIKDMITSAQGTIEKADKWGVRKLAYRVQKYSEGLYILIAFKAPPGDLVKEIERRMRNADSVIKFITVRIDERMKKVDKRKKAREKRAAKKPPPQMATPAVPMAPAMPAPAAPAVPVAHPMPAAPAPAEAPSTQAEPVAVATETKTPVTE
jgi:small subunit ribosomal protein S6